ncbi:MAG: tagaturonate reductase [Clostridia bacterium]|nr:tagaturonate reductase [Clostridia bacterium]MCI9085616.1 tagaturonate reductase [Clostridia bacterium]
MNLLKRTTETKHTERILQFGEGNFLRGFVDYMFDRLNKEYSSDFGVAVVQPRPGDKITKLNNQDGLYTLYSRGLINGVKAEEVRIVECITRGINPYENTAEFFECAQNPDLRYIVSNTTEAGIEYKKEECNFNTTTFPGRLTMFLKARYDTGLGGFLLLPCELIDRNGDCLKDCVLKYARDWDYGEDFVKWVNEENVFTNTLVDRIVTGYPKDTAKEMEERLGYHDNMIDTTEIFHLWVIEGDKKYANELPFDKTGLNVIWTDDVTPYKKRKVRILNGAHTTLVSSAMLMGVETVREAMDNEILSEYIKKSIFDEIIPTIDMSESELVGFANDVLDRFRNPFINHYWSSIALNSVSKFKVRVLPSIKDYIDKFDKTPKCLVFSLAALIVFYKTGNPNDDKEVIDFMKRSSLAQILSNTNVWGDNLMYLKELVEKYILLIKTDGIKSGLNEALEKGFEECIR